MKFAVIVLLGLCAISAQAYPSVNENAKLGLLPDSVNDLVADLLAAVGSLKQRAEEVTVTVKEIVESVMYQGVQKVSNAVAKAESQLKSLDSYDCVNDVMPAVIEANSQLKADAEKCTQSLLDHSKLVKSEIHDLVKILETNVKDFYGIAKQCIHFNPIESIKCVYEHMGDFKTHIMDMIKSTTEYLSNIVTKTAEQAKESGECTKDAVLKFNKVQKQVVQSVKKCIADKRN